MNNISEEIKKLFDDGDYHHVDDIVCSVKKIRPEANEESIKRIIRRLRSSQNIYKITNDIYVAGQKKQFEPPLSKSIKTINNFIYKTYPAIDVIIWDTSWLKSYSHNYFNVNYKIVEVERGFENTIFEHLTAKFSRVYLNPTEKEYEKYVFQKDCIVVKTKVLRAPKINFSNIETPKLEKIIADIVIDEVAFSWLKGKELEKLTLNLIENYEVDLSTLFQYANYRNKAVKVKEALIKYTSKIESEDSTISYIKKCVTDNDCASQGENIKKSSHLKLKGVLNDQSK